MPMLRRIVVNQVLWGLLLTVIAGCEVFDPPIYHAEKTWDTLWYVGASPEVVIHVYAGRIRVTRGSDGEVRASFRVSRISKNSQEVADQAVKSARGFFAQTQVGGTIRIIEGEGAAAECSVDISIPAGSRLDLRATGNICVGCPEAFTIASLKARTGEVGSIETNLLSRPFEAPHLDLDVDNPDNLMLILDGVRVDLRPASNYDQASKSVRWRYRSE